MSADRASDDADNTDLPTVERDAVSTGAAANSADGDERLKGLPRLLRYAMLISGKASHIKQRLIAEINELCPNLPLNAAWAAPPVRFYHGWLLLRMAGSRGREGGCRLRRPLLFLVQLNFLLQLADHLSKSLGSDGIDRAPKI
jgi:hypothetical protein